METNADSPVYLAVDFGAGSGRVIAGILENGILRLEEVHRFANDGVRLAGTWHWRAGQQFADMLEGLKKAAKTYGGRVRSVGVDTWGVDYGLIDEGGGLLGLPAQYRDGRAEGMIDKACERMPAKELYAATGNQFMFYNTAFQLMAERERNPGRLDAADRLLFMPDLFNFWLCGVKANEATIASTAQLVDASTGEWATGVMDKLDIPKKLFGDLVQPGAVLGDLRDSVGGTTGLKAKVVAVGSHDTASAYAAVPSRGDDGVYLSSGTWSLLGVLSKEAVINDESFDLAFTNERAVGGGIRLLKILCGMWILQECKRVWEEREPVEWDTLTAEAAAAEPFAAFIDPDDPRFATPGDMPARLKRYCRDTGQAEPRSRGNLTRMVLESLALKYRLTTDRLKQLLDRDFGTFHVVGGGSRNALLNQFTANALDRRVAAGPVKATAAGNILVQLQADGEIAGPREGGDLIRRSFEVEHFEPQNAHAWEQALEKFQDVISRREESDPSDSSDESDPINQPRDLRFAPNNQQPTTTNIMSTQRYLGSLPKIGIRPTIDGRLGGVRESLEDQTMAMAQSVADLISANLKAYNGEAVECVIADSCIGGVAESAACADKFARGGVGASITVTPCWCYGSETMDMDPLIPKAVWGFNGTERPGAVYLAAMQAAHNQKGLPIFTIYGRDVQDAGDTSIPGDVQEKLLRFARAAFAAAFMKGKSYLGMGNVSMGIMGSYADHEFFETYLGMRVEAVDMVEFVRRMDRGVYDPDEFDKALAWVKENCPQGADYNPEDRRDSPAEHAKTWETSVKMALIARDLMVGNPRLKELGFGEEARGHNAVAAGFQGQRQWTDHLPNGDFMEAILTTSFDWNGKRAPYMLATENDTLNAVSMLFGNLITNGAQIFADVRTYWSPEAVKRVTGHSLEGRAAGGFLHLINSGPAALDGAGEQSVDGEPAMKPHWEISDEEVKACLNATTWHPAINEYFRGGGFSCRFKTRGGMPMTLVRINLTRGLGPALQIAEGWSIELPEDVHDTLDERTNPTWPTTWFVPRTREHGVFRDAYSVMNAWGSNHGAFSHGHIGADLISLAAMLRIPVYMHNVEDEKVFRPSAWNSFGTRDLEGADFRACRTFGPLYG